MNILTVSGTPSMIGLDIVIQDITDENSIMRKVAQLSKLGYTRFALYEGNDETYKFVREYRVEIPEPIVSVVNRLKFFEGN